MNRKIGAVFSRMLLQFHGDWTETIGQFIFTHFRLQIHVDDMKQHKFAN